MRLYAVNLCQPEVDRLFNIVHSEATNRLYKEDDLIESKLVPMCNAEGWYIGRVALEAIKVCSNNPLQVEWIALPYNRCSSYFHTRKEAIANLTKHFPPADIGAY